MGVKAPGSPFRVIRPEDAEVSVLGLSAPITEAIKEVEVKDTRTIDLLNLQLQRLHADIAGSQKVEAELRGQLKDTARVIEVPVEKIVERIVEKPIAVVREIKVPVEVKVLDWSIVAAAVVAGAGLGALLCYILL